MKALCGLVALAFGLLVGCGNKQESGGDVNSSDASKNPSNTYKKAPDFPSVLEVTDLRLEKALVDKGFRVDGGKITYSDKVRRTTKLTLDGWEINNLEGLGIFQNLEMLRFNGTQITDEGLKELAELKKLVNLDLGGTNITDEGLKEVAKLQQLTHLSLHKTSITDVGLKEVAKLQKLEKLFVGVGISAAGGAPGPQITDKGLKQLAKLQNLRNLYLNYENKFTDAGVAELRKSLQN